MYYVKIIEGSSCEVEIEANAFLAEITNRGHRVMVTKVCNDADKLFITFAVNDEPHPHKKPSR
jgi:hypothetical protein